MCISSPPSPFLIQRKAKSATPTVAAGDSSDTTRKPGESDQNIRKVLARQHAKDISEYTKQIHAKDREIGELKKKTIKVCSRCEITSDHKWQHHSPPGRHTIEVPLMQRWHDNT